MTDYDRRPLPQRGMPSRRISPRGGGGGGRGGGGQIRNYSSADEEEYSYYDEEEDYDDGYYEDEDDGYYDDRQYNHRRRSSSSGDDQYNNSGRSNNNRYSKHNSFHDSSDFRNRNYNRGGGRELVEYDDFNGGGGRRGGRDDRHHSRSNSRGGGGQLTPIVPASTPKQAQDIIRRYTLGMPLQNPMHMALPPTTPPEGPAREIATLQVANLIPKEYAFVRRSNGMWTFAQVAVRHDLLGQLVFIVNKMGSTKTFKRHEWPGFVRRIKWTERRVQLPPKPLLLEAEVPGQLALENGPNRTSPPPPPPAAAVAPGQRALENGPSKASPAVAPNTTTPTPSILGKQQQQQQKQQQQLPEVSAMSIKEMKMELKFHGIDFSFFMEKQEFRNAVIDARAEAVKNALIKEQQLLRQQQQERQELEQTNQQQQQQQQQQQHDHGFDNPNEINLNSTLDADLSNLAGQTITLQPMQDDEVSELMGDYLLTEYKFQMKVLERERIKKQNAGKKMVTINEHGDGGNDGDGQQSSAYQSFNIEGEKSLPHYERQTFAKSQKWGSVSEDV
ncbi:hypothetical protein ACHAXM_011568 [Skeletonema potamos]